MQDLTTMKQWKLLLLLQLLSACQALQTAQRQPRSYDELYADGLSSYSDENWPDTITYFRQAIADYTRVVKAREQCYAECNGQTVSVPQDYAHSGDLRFFHGVLQRSTCVEKCRERVTGGRWLGGVSGKVEENMASRKPYNYLQLALYKVGFKIIQKLKYYYYYYTFSMFVLIRRRVTC